jgi:hypothetical protein
MLAEWYERTRAFLIEEMGEEYLHRFESSAGLLAFGMDTKVEAPERNRQVWTWLNQRATRLNQLLEAMQR